MGIVSTIPEKCRRCYTCVRECPAKAIRVLAGQAAVVAERCIACGNCVTVCTQQAKKIEDSTALVKRMLEGGGKVFACLAPSFPVAFPGTSSGRIVSALRRLGFSEVWEAAFGAELISCEYARLAGQALESGRVVVSTPCPAIVMYIEKYLPSLVPALAPIVSPMIATARAIRKKHGDRISVVFIGPCIAKKAEITDSNVQGAVDAALTYDELVIMLEGAGIDPEDEEPGVFDGPVSGLARSLPISGGLLRSAGITTDILRNSVLVTEGKDRVMPALRELADGKSRVRLLDALFCEGCINGPKMIGELTGIARKEMLADFVNAGNEAGAAGGMVGGTAGETAAVPAAGGAIRHAARPATRGGFGAVDLARRFSAQPVALPQPTEEQIEAALRSMRKFTLADHLNCGSCGYPSCREKAIAVCQGLAEVSMCLPYMVEELESSLKTLQHSHQDAQARLAKSERLASMGQISAGVAHEINNPLSTILLYSHMLLKERKEGDPDSEDIRMIVNEANRCRSIMRGLLDFARQSRVVKAPTDVGILVRDLVDTTLMKLGDSLVRVRCEIEEGMPLVPLDAEQIRQMLENLVQNGIDAIGGNGKWAGKGGGGGAGGAGIGRGEGTGRGEVVVSAGLSESGHLVVLRVRDTGCGIPQEALKDIFTPFYTTKQLGKGTGMGLSIVYGVVKMHAGDISVDSEVGKGTTFTVRIPIGERSKEEIHERGNNSAAGG